MLTDQVLYKILEIIDYKNNKEAFVQKFLTICKQEAIYNCLDNLPQGIQEQIKKEIQNLSVDECIKVLQKHISQEQFQKELQSTSNNTLKEYVTSIAYTLSKGQKEKLKAFVEAIISTMPHNT